MKSANVLLALVVAAVSLSTLTPVAAPRLSAWSMPVNLGPLVNSPSLDGGPAISKNGLSLYFPSDRPGGNGGSDIWVSQRASVDAPWDTPANLGPTINTSYEETVPTFSRDEHWMFFASTRPGGEGNTDIWVSWRSQTHDDFGWQTPVHLGLGINTTARDEGPTLFEGEGLFPPTLFFVSNRLGGFGFLDVYASELQTNGSFGTPIHISELSSTSSDARPTIRFDGCEIILFSNRPEGFGNFSFDLWVSTRASLGSTWELPENLGPIINSDANEIQPYLSGDGRMLLFASDRPGGSGNYDLYMTVRAKPGR